MERFTYGSGRGRPCNSVGLLAYPKAYDSVAEARASIGRYLDCYNRKRPHSSLGARTPDQAYFDRQPQGLAA
jgi:putative transposase